MAAPRPALRSHPAPPPASLPAQRRRAAPPARPDLRLVTPPPARRLWRRPRMVVGLTATLVTIVLFGLVAAHVSLAQGQFRLQRLERRAEAAQVRYEELRLDVAELEAPARVVAAAQERLGMVPPPGVTYLSPTGPAGEVTPATTTPDTATPKAGRTEQAAGADATASWLDVKRELGRRP